MQITAFVFEKALGYFVTAICGGMVAAIVHLWRKVIEVKKKQEAQEKIEAEQNEAMRDAMRALMRDRIFQACKYHMNNGFITTGDLEVLDSMNDSYHKLNGNGIAARVMQQIHKLPIRVEEMH